MQKIPLSFAQQRLWFFDQYQPNSSVYNIPTVWRLKGRLDVRALERSINEIVRRHGSLRTTFPTVDGEPVQLIAPALEVVVPVEDLTGLPANEREDKAQRLVRAQRSQPFDLSRGPLLRLLLIRCGQDDHVLALTMHHIVSDGWSRGVLHRELSSLYEAYTQGKASPLAELAIQYADFAIWQRRWLQGEVLEEQLSYWKAQLAGAPALLNLPTDRPRPAVRSYRGASLLIELCGELSEGIKALSATHGVTLFMTLLAAFQTLLYRYSGQEDIVVGTPIANRIRQEIEDLIGFFVNTLVIRTDLSGNPTFTELLRRVRETALEAYAHQDLPFEKLVEEVHPERHLSQSPLFQVMFVLQNAPGGAAKFAGLEVSSVSGGEDTAKFDLTLSMETAGEGLRGLLQYSTELFDAITIETMRSCFQTLLEGLVADPEQPISELPLLTPSQRHQLLVAWNDNKQEYPRDKCIHQLFEEQVEKSPEAIAVQFEDQHLTYREFNHRANQLARYLRQRGVGPEVSVGICIERSLDMAVGLLAILKAGGAYVPLDSASPQQRLAFMLEDARAQVLLTQSRFQKLFASFAGTRVCIDNDWADIARETPENPTNAAAPENLAYVIYTSGSTGQPKGVMIEHRQLMNYLVGITERLDLTSQKSFATVSTLAADLGHTVIFPALLTGAVLHIISQDRITDAEALADYFGRHAIDCLKIVPSHLLALLRVSQPERLMPRRLLILGGEASDFEWALRLTALAPNCRIVNHYGPTEATVGVTTYTFDRNALASGSGQLPLGRPIANTEIYILDSSGHPVPISVPGELYIGGLGLARGYLNQAKLTAEKFIKHPFNAEPLARLYKTGDRARYLPDGNIEFLGRIDNQIKLRGYRIEPGEIEAAIKQHTGVREAVVLGREDPDSEKRVVAYVLEGHEHRLNANELRSFLLGLLPEYMLPSVFVILDSLPLTPNGKIDRNALPAPDEAILEPGLDFVAPRSATETALASIWANVLKINKVGIHDNFFGLGGHSLLAVQLIARVREIFKLGLSVRDLFQAPTVAGFAQQMESTRIGKPPTEALPVLAGKADSDYPLSFSQERFWFLQQLQHNNPAYKSTHGFNIRGSLNTDALSHALSEIVRRHEVLRTTFHLNRGRPVQRVSGAEAFELSVVNLSHKRDVALSAEVQEILKGRFGLPFDLSNDVLLRATLIKLNDDEHILFLVVHHIAWDHWCIEIFFDELSALYQAFCGGKPSPLPDLPIQYKDYALWQRKILQGEEMNHHLGYWKKQLEGSPPLLQLPSDRRRPSKQTFGGGRKEVVLADHLVHALKSLSQRQGATLFMTLLAAFKILLRRLAAQDDIVVGAPVAGRDRIETENLLGCFLNSVVLRTNLSGSPTFRQLLGRVREVVLGAFDHQELPFEKLLEEMSVARDPSRTPLFQVFVNSYSLETEQPALHDLDLKPLEITKPAANFDLTFYVRERDKSTILIFVYNADIFEDERMAEMLDQYQGLLAQIVENPDQTIDAYSLVTSAARRLLPNPSETLYTNWVGSVHDRLSDQAARLPEKLAVVDASDRWTYRQLNARANQLAHYLVEKGMQPEDVVAIYGHRSASMVWAVLGVLKAGAAFLILDPAYPAKRLVEYLRGAQPRGFVRIEAAGGLSGELEKYIERNIALRILLPRVSDLSPNHPLKTYSSADLNLEIKPENLAYISFTSGSTGEPKGVLGRHGPLSHFLPWQSKKFGLGSSDRFSLLSGLSHDPLQREIFTTLWVGGTICIPGAEVLETPGELFNWMLQQGITFAHLTPPMGRILTEGCRDGSESLALRYAFFVGDKLTSADVESVQRIAPQATCVNYYGSTETQRAVSYYEIPPGSNVVFNREIVPVGQGMPNVQLLVLNNEQGLAGIGEVGEIYMRSPHLARGYLNDMSLTRVRFLANPLTHDSADLCYMTGDLGRYLPDGNVEILGRIDRQIKIRGFRVEVGEIESVLKQHSDIKDAMVLPRSHGSENLYLAAYLTAQAGKTPRIAELQALLKSKLPTYMIPFVTMILEKFPLTPNGKIDTEALPLLDAANIELQSTFVPPRTPLEKAVAEIWAEVLARDQVGIDDNFFELGGHSLAAMLVLSRISVFMHTRLPLSAIFEQPTVAGLAGRIESIQAVPVAQEEITKLVGELESLSDDEAQMLADRQRWENRKV